MKNIILLDDGERYIWKNPESNKELKIEYGSFILMLIYLGNEFLIGNYEDIVGYKELTLLANMDSEVEEDINYEEHLPEYLESEERELQAYIADSVSWGIPDDVKYVLKGQEVELLKKVIEIDMNNIFHDAKTIKIVQRNIPSFLEEQQLQDILRKILLDGNSKKKKVSVRKSKEIKLLMNYFENIPLASTTIYEKDSVKVRYHITGLAQLMMVELIGLEKSKKKYKFLECKHCGKIFRERRKPGGRDSTYCSYKYSEGSCQKQEELDNKTELEIESERCDEAVRKYCERKYNELGLELNYRSEFETWSGNVIKKANITAKQYKNLFKQWWAVKKKETKQMAAMHDV